MCKENCTKGFPKQDEYGCKDQYLQWETIVETFKKKDRKIHEQQEIIESLKIKYNNLRNEQQNLKTVIDFTRYYNQYSDIDYTGYHKKYSDYFLWYVFLAGYLSFLIPLYRIFF